MRQTSRAGRLSTLCAALLLACSDGIVPTSDDDRVRAGLIALYEFDEGEGSVVHDTSGQGGALDLTIQTPSATTWTSGALRVSSPTLIRSATRATKLISGAVAANAVTVEAWIVPQTANQPEARILTNSLSYWARNLTLGQGITPASSGSNYEARLRTTASNHQGMPGLSSPSGTAQSSLQHVIFTRETNGATRLYVDGSLRANGTSGGTVSWDAGFVLGLANEIDGSRPWLGELHLIALYSRALSAAEVQQNFAAGPDGDGSEPEPPTSEAPVARLLATPRSGAAPLAIAFDARGSTAPSGTVTGHEWAFGDGTSATGAQTNHTYTSPGEYHPRLRVRSGSGEVSDAVALIRATGPGGAPRATAGLTALYQFEEGSGTIVRDTSGVGTALDLTIQTPSATSWTAGALRVSSPTVIRSEARATKLINAAVSANAISVEAWVVPRAANQPEARIVTNSLNYWARNLTLGQGVTAGSSGSAYEARVRTSSSNVQGIPGLISPSNTVAAALQHVLFTRDTNGVTQLYVDGTLRANGATGGMIHWDPGFALALANELDGTRPWLGDLHLVALYGRALSASEVQQNFAAGPNGAAAPSQAPSPVASVSPASGIVPLRAVFDAAGSSATTGASIASYAWAFGDGASATGARVTHAYTSPGSYSARLTTTDSQGRSASVTLPVQALQTNNTPPIATFTRSPASGTVPLTVSFDARSSTDPDGTIASYSWSFGDGTTGTGATASHVYSAAGSFLVQLTVGDDDGATTSTTLPVQVTNEPTTPVIGAGDVPFDHVLVDAEPPLQTHVKAVGDIDGDGLNDAVIAGAGNGDGGLFWYQYPSFTRYEIRPMGDTGFTTEGKLADVDRDGDLDIVVPKGVAIGSEVFWYENPRPDDDPETDEWAEHRIGTAPAHDVNVADLDGDGRLDVVVRKNTLTAFFQTGNDVWTPQTLSTLTSEGQDLGDVDGDGDIDVVINGRWFENPRPGNAITGTWTVRNYTSPFPNDAAVRLLDLSGDGRLDVVMTSSEGAFDLAWYQNPGNPSSNTNWTKRLIATGQNFNHRIEAGDVDLDGDPDLVTAEMHQSSGTDDVILWMNEGSGTTWTRQVIDTKGSHNQVLADIDNDGDLDVFGANWHGQSGVDLWRNLLNPNPRMARSWTRSLVDATKPARSLMVEAGDFDGDGFRDIATGGWWYENPNGNLGGTWTRRAFGAPLNNFGVLFDFDRDGDLDALGTRGVGIDSNHDFAWAQNDGAGAFTVRTNIQSPTSGTFLQGIFVRAVQPTTASQVYLAFETFTGGTNVLDVPSNPAQATWPLRSVSPTAIGEGLDYGDVDRDGDLDVLLGNRYLRNDGTTFATVDLFALSGTQEPDRNRWVDMDGDGDLDALITFGHDPRNEVAWFENPGWAKHLITQKTNPRSMDVADLDGDGDPDIVLGEELTNGSVYVFEHLGGTGRHFRQHVVYTGDEHHDGTRLFDLDNDGDLDIVSIGFASLKVTAYESPIND